MKKVVISVIAGILLGVISTVLFLDYEADWTSYTYSGTDSRSEPVITKEMDFDFVFYMTLLTIMYTTGIFLLWTFIEKKRDEQIFNEYQKRKK